MPTISKFQTNFKGGARPNRFEVMISTPSESLEDCLFHCKGASQPSSTLGETIIPYMGRQYKVPGDRTFDDWTVTIMNDNEHGLRKSLEEWHELMQAYEGNVGDSDMSALLGTGEVWQMDREAGDLHHYSLEGMWPKEIGAIELSWDNNDAIEEFTVTFAVNWIEPG